MIIPTPNATYKFIGRDNNLGDEAVVRETWVENVYDLHTGLLDDTGIFIDLGANIGSVSIYIASLGKFKVYAYEPEPHNLELLKKNTLLNKCQDVEVIPKAVWSKRGKLNVENRSGGSRVSDKGTEVEAITLDDVFSENKITNCDLLKMDIEGAEVEVFKTVELRTLKKIKHLRMEYHVMTAHSFGMIISKLSKCYNVHLVGSYKTGGNLSADRY